MKTVNEIIRELREDRDLKQIVVANRIGISQQQYSRYENGKSQIPLETLPILADYYGVSTDYLMGRKGIANGDPGLEKKVLHTVTVKDESGISIAHSFSLTGISVNSLFLIFSIPVSSDF